MGLCFSSWAARLTKDVILASRSFAGRVAAMLGWWGGAWAEVVVSTGGHWWNGVKVLARRDEPLSVPAPRLILLALSG